MRVATTATPAPVSAPAPSTPIPQPPPTPAGTLRCPKCQGTMRTYDRNGIHLEQCDSCRGIFLDFGELESLTQLESRFVAAPPPPQVHVQGYSHAPGWGHHGQYHYRKKGFGGLFFSS